MASKKENRKLIKQYPFLQIRDYNDNLDKYFNYTYLDDLPNGWKKTFGLSLCEAIKSRLLQHDRLNEYRIEQVKEKFGSLRWYDNANDILEDIIMDYEHISEFVCVNCGKINVPMRSAGGWISPFCDRCVRGQLGVRELPSKDRDICSYKYIKYVNGKAEEHTVDCTELVNHLISES